MGRKSRGKAKKDEWVFQKPDDVFIRGHLRVERYGRFVRMANTATPEEHAALRHRIRDAGRKVLEDLEGEVATLQSLIAKYDPIELMYRAAHVLMAVFVGGRAESEVSSEEAYALPTVEYIQYLIARTNAGPRGVRQTEEEWAALWDQALKVFHLTNSYLFVRRSSTEKSTAIDHLRFMIDAQRLGIRIDRYEFFRAAHLRSSLSPYERQLTQIYGIGVEDIVAGLDQISVYQRTGVFDRYDALVRTRAELMERLALAGHDLGEDASPEEVASARDALALEPFKTLNERVIETSHLALTPALFDITDLTSLPKEFLCVLSVRPAESVLTTLTGPDHDDLSPLSPSPLHHKPFLEVEGRYYTFYHSGFEDRIADLIEADLLGRLPGRVVVEMMSRRGERLETDAAELLASLVRPEFVHRNVYYPNPDDPGSLTELDVLMGVDDVLFLVEAKAGAMDAAARRGAPASLAQALSDLIVDGQRQSERAERYLRSDPEVTFFDSGGSREVVRLKHSEFRKVFRVIVTREELGWVGAKIAILSVLDPTLSVSVPWHVSIDDLRVIEHLFRNDPIRFVHYLEVRLMAAGQRWLSQADELEHVGLYNKMNYYHEPPVRDVSRMSYHASYMVDIDHYFMDKSAGIATDRPTQAMPAKVRRLIDGLEASRLPGRFEAGSIVLSMHSDARRTLSDGLGTLQEGLSYGRQRSFRTFFDDIGISFSYASGLNWEDELRRSAVQMSESRLNRWVAVQISADRPELEVARIEVIRPGRFRNSELRAAKAAFARKTQELIDAQQPGRNDPCPCGSRKKFKKCHGT